MKYCTHCGAELMDEAVLCTKCGCWVTPGSTSNSGEVTLPSANEQNAKLNVCSLIGFILSMASIIFFVNFMGLLALAGMIVSIVGLVQLARNNNQKGKGFAVPGVVVGACMTMFGILIWMAILLP